MGLTGMFIVAEAAGFGFNFNILQANLINLAIVISILVYFGRNLLGKALADRKAEIEQAIQEAEQRKQTAAAALADEQQKLARAQTEASRIRAEAEERAKATREAVLKQAQEDIERMKSAAAQDLTSQQERITNELRQRIAALAIAKAETELRSSLNDDRQRQLVDRSIATIGGA